MTMLDHPTSGENELWRSNAYDSLDSLKKILKNPRLHTGVGYRRAADRKYACCVCGELRGAELFSKNQTRNPVGTQKCKECLDKKAVSVDEVTSQLDGFALEQAQDDGGSGGGGGGSSPLYRSRTEKLAAQAAGGGGGAGGSALTAGNLERHDQKTSVKVDKTKLERRQFCCPNHAKPHLYFKKVPKYKPAQKCPLCKATNHDTPRLLPVPQSATRGYALFRCTKCNSKWGSSRGGPFGMFCNTPDCTNCTQEVPIFPFRITPWKKKQSKKKDDRNAAFASDGMITSMPISEERENDDGYVRDSAGGGGGGAFDHGDEFDFASREPPKPKIEHRCTGCKTGACNNVKVPISKRHESTGSTNSSSGRSGKTFSTLDDEDDYQDRDEDFAQ
ncbi:hypothetical protein TeGR_g14180 [Tetraparma gracilis]|nr:hypothetical protein TeGR_g14180 [Tetraparma gracilis]